MKIEQLSSNEAARPVFSPASVDAGNGQPLARQVSRHEVSVLLSLHEDKLTLLGFIQGVSSFLPPLISLCARIQQKQSPELATPLNGRVQVLDSAIFWGWQVLDFHFWGWPAQDSVIS